MSKVKLQLRPYTALGILSFMREYINKSNSNIQELAAIHEAVDEFEEEIGKNISTDQIEDARLEVRVNDITNRHPPKFK